MQFSSWGLVHSCPANINRQWGVRAAQLPITHIQPMNQRIVSGQRRWAPKQCAQQIRRPTCRGCRLPDRQRGVQGANIFGGGETKGKERHKRNHRKTGGDGERPPRTSRGGQPSPITTAVAIESPSFPALFPRERVIQTKPGALHSQPFRNTSKPSAYGALGPFEILDIEMSWELFIGFSAPLQHPQPFGSESCWLPSPRFQVISCNTRRGSSG